MVSPQYRPPAPKPPRKRKRRSGSSPQSTASPQPRIKRVKRSPKDISKGTPNGKRTILSGQPRRSAPPQKSSFDRAIVVQTLELGVKLGVNGILGVAAILGLVKLVPYTLHRHHGLQQLQAEAIAVEGRVNALQKDFGRYFDPKEAEAIARQETIRIAPNQKRIHWRPDPTAASN